MTIQEKRSTVVRYWFEKAEESMASTRREFEAGSLSFAMNQLYYSAFYTVSALLMDRELSFLKFKGISSDFYHPGVWDRHHGNIRKRSFFECGYYFVSATKRS